MHKEDSKLALWWHGLNKNTIKCYQETMFLKALSDLLLTGKIAGRIPFRGDVLVSEWSTTTLVMQKGG